MKDTFASFANRCTCPPDLPVCVCGKEPVLDIVTRKPRLPQTGGGREKPEGAQREAARGGETLTKSMQDMAPDVLR